MKFYCHKEPKYLVRKPHTTFYKRLTKELNPFNVVSCYIAEKDANTEVKIVYFSTKLEGRKLTYTSEISNILKVAEGFHKLTLTRNLAKLVISEAREAFKREENKV